MKNWELLINQGRDAYSEERSTHQSPPVMIKEQQAIQKYNQ